MFPSKNNHEIAPKSAISFLFFEKVSYLKKLSQNLLTNPLTCDII